MLLWEVISCFQVRFHQDVDNTQLYITENQTDGSLEFLAEGLSESAWPKQVERVTVYSATI